MSQEIESVYKIDVDEAMKSFERLADKYDKIADKQEKLNNTGFDKLGSEIADYQRKLADGSAIYQKVEVSAKGLRDEMKRLTDIQKALTRAQVEFKDSAKFDVIQKDLQAVRGRLEQVKDAYKTLNEGTDKAAKATTTFGGVLKSAAVALAAFFTVDKAIDIGKSIIENTKNYEKYFAVLRNGFQDEQRASAALEMIYDFAKKTPYQVNELTEAYTRLVNRGFAPTRAEMQKMGDFASSNAKSMTQWVEAIVDAETNQYERLKEFGIGFETIGNKVVFTFRGIRKEVEKTDKEAIRNALISFGELNGVVGAMSARSLTLEGAISNLGDSYDQLLTKIGTGNSGALKTMVGLLQSAVDWAGQFISVPLDQKYQQERAEINSLVGALIQFKDNAELRNQIYTELGNKYPSILKLIGTEVTTTEFLAETLAKVNKEYERKIQLAALQEAVNIKTKQQADLQIKMLDLEKQIQSTVESRLKKQGNQALYQRYLTGDTNTRQQIEQSVGRQLEAEAARGRATVGMSTVTPEEITLNAAYSGALANRNKLQKELNAQMQDAITLTGKMSAKEKEQQTLIEQNIKSNKEKIAQLKTKNSLSKEEQNTITALTNQNKEYEKQLAIAKGTYKEPSMAAPKTEDKAAKKVREELEKENEKLLKLQKEFMEKMNSLQLEASNVRLSQLDKNSKEYLDRKRAYDLQVIDSELEKYKQLFDVQAGKVVNRGGQVKTESFTEGRTSQLMSQGKTKSEAQKIADMELDAMFLNSQKTNKVRELMWLKAEAIDRQYQLDILKMTKDFEDTKTSLMGEGLDKTLKEIDRRYAEIKDKYKNNEEILKAALVSYNADIEKATLESRLSSIEKAKEGQTGAASLMSKGAGELESEFEKRKKDTLLDIERQFYKDKLDLLIEFTQKQAYIEAVTNGNISKEQAEAYQKRIEDLQLAIKKLDVESKQGRFTTDRYRDGWELVGDVFDSLTGKVLKFSDDIQLDDFVKKQITTAIGYAKQGLSDLLDLEISESDKRISELEKQVDKRQEIVDEEYERYKKGLANRYSAEKETLDTLQKEREKEVERKKKLQKEKAIIDSLEIVSANAVAAANMVVAASKAIADGASKGLVGIAVGIALALSLAGIFLSIKSKFKQAQKLRYGKKLSGRSHEQGGLNILDNEGNVQYEAEGDEWLMGAKPSRKHDKLLSTINDDSFRTKTKAEQLKLLRPLGLKMHEASNEIPLRRQQAATGSKDSEWLKQIAQNTKDGVQFVYVGENRVAKIKSGKVIEIQKFNN